MTVYGLDVYTLFFSQRINEKVSVVAEYESGRALPNQQVIAKMERVLGKVLCAN